MPNDKLRLLGSSASPFVRRQVLAETTERTNESTTPSGCGGSKPDAQISKRPTTQSTGWNLEEGGRSLLLVVATARAAAEKDK